MALLAHGNTEFETSVTRSWSPHYKSTSLRNVVAALVQFQHTGTGGNLRTLYERLYDWISANPKEYAKRGRLVEALRQEILLTARALGVGLAALDSRFKHVSHVWEAVFLQQIQVKAALHHNVWGQIRITDEPTGVPGHYDLTREDPYAEMDRSRANLETNEVAHHKENCPNLWLRLGRRVTTPQLDGHCYGRCFSCAAAVIYELVMDQAFDEYMIEHIGATGYDHHLVLVDRVNANGNDATGLDRPQEWMSAAAVFDVWQANLNHNTDYVRAANANRYVQGELRWFCAFPPNRRAQDRAFASQLAAPVRQHIDLDRIQQAKNARRDEPEGEYVRVDGRWVPRNQVQ